MIFLNFFFFFVPGSTALLSRKSWFPLPNVWTLSFWDAFPLLQRPLCTFQTVAVSIPKCILAHIGRLGRQSDFRYTLHESSGARAQVLYAGIFRLSCFWVQAGSEFSPEVQGLCPCGPEFKLLWRSPCSHSLSTALHHGCLSSSHCGKVILEALKWSCFLVIMSHRFK